MFHVYVTVFKFCKNHCGYVIHSDANDIFKDLQLSDPMEVVQLFDELPNDSLMYVYDEDDNSYKFSKGELLKSEEDSDIDLFPWYYV